MANPSQESDPQVSSQNDSDDEDEEFDLAEGGDREYCLFTFDLYNVQK